MTEEAVELFGITEADIRPGETAYDAAERKLRELKETVAKLEKALEDGRTQETKQTPFS